MRFTSVDLPTFGRPTTATTGGGPESSTATSSPTAESPSSQSLSSDHVPSLSVIATHLHVARPAPPGGQSPRTPTCRRCRPPAHRRPHAAETPREWNPGGRDVLHRPAPLRS